MRTRLPHDAPAVDLPHHERLHSAQSGDDRLNNRNRLDQHRIGEPEHGPVKKLNRAAVEPCQQVIHGYRLAHPYDINVVVLILGNRRGTRSGK